VKYDPIGSNSEVSKSSKESSTPSLAQDNRWQLVLNNGAIIGHDDLIGVVDPNTKHTYEQVQRPLYEHNLIVGELPNLVEHLSNSVNIDVPVPEGSHLSFHILSIT
jgi:hypothetical protein